MKKIFLGFLISLFAVLLFLGGFVFFLSRPINKSAVGESELVRIEIPAGFSVKQTASLLCENKLIRNETFFYLCARYPILLKFFYNSDINSFVLKSGIYHISPSMNNAEIIAELSSGKQEYFSVSIPEGFTISKIAALLEEKNICSSHEFMSICYDADFISTFNLPPETASLEGFLFPDTYFFNPGESAKNVVLTMTDNFFKKLSTITELSKISAGDLYDAVILSSIVEREYRVADEAPLIASVFKNRLKQNIGLYSCATVEYIITEIQGKPHPKRILIEDTKIDNPYNTYKWAGLPPGPISNPGMTALNAVFNAPKTNYYFFQVKDSKEGTHVFTSTFDEHIENHNLVTK